jgi:hypothetical protein
LNHSIDQSDRAISRFDQPVQSIAHLSLPSLQLSQVLRPASRFYPSIHCCCLRAINQSIDRSINPSIHPLQYCLHRVTNSLNAIDD